MEKNFVGALTAVNATETVKSLLDTYTVPQGVTKLVEVGAQLTMAGLTTLEGVSFILELECDDSSSWGGTQQFVSDTVLPVTSGAASEDSRLQHTGAGWESHQVLCDLQCSADHQPILPSVWQVPVVRFSDPLDL